MNQNELYHHGILGQKWGVRRYQNTDGSLTSAGKRKYGTKTNFNKVQAAKRAAEKNSPAAKKARAKADARTAAEIAKYRKKVKDNANLKSNGKDKGKTDSKPKSKSISEMSEEELMNKANRLNAERYLIDAQKNHLQSQQQLAALTPKKESAIKKLAYGAVKDVVIPKAVDLGVSYVEKKLGLKDGSMDKLKKEAEIAGYQKKIYEAKDAAYKNLKNAREEANYQAKQKSDKESAKSETKTESKSETKTDNKTEPSSNSKMNAQKGPKFNSWTKNTKNDDVVGEGTSQYSGTKKGTIYDAEEGKDYYYINKNTTVNNMSSSNVNKGNSYAQKLLSTDYGKQTLLLEDKGSSSNNTSKSSKSSSSESPYAKQIRKELERQVDILDKYGSSDKAGESSWINNEIRGYMKETGGTSGIDDVLNELKKRYE